MPGQKKHKWNILMSAILTLVLLSACKRETHDWIPQEEGHSILDLEYINDTLGIRLMDIRSAEIAQDSFRINVYVVPYEGTPYDASYRFFLHLYEDPSQENEGSFLPVGTLDFSKKQKALIYSRRFKSTKRKYSRLRYGMMDPEGRRLFSLSVDTIDIEL